MNKTFHSRSRIPVTEIPLGFVCPCGELYGDSRCHHHEAAPTVTHSGYGALTGLVTVRERTAGWEMDVHRWDGHQVMQGAA